MCRKAKEKLRFNRVLKVLKAYTSFCDAFFLNNFFYETLIYSPPTPHTTSFRVCVCGGGGGGGGGGGDGVEKWKPK